jgi:hypothetical protein
MELNVPYLIQLIGGAHLIYVAGKGGKYIGCVGVALIAVGMYLAGA